MHVIEMDFQHLHNKKHYCNYAYSDKTENKRKSKINYELVSYLNESICYQTITL